MIVNFINLFDDCNLQVARFCKELDSGRVSDEVQRYIAESPKSERKEDELNEDMEGAIGYQNVSNSASSSVDTML